MLDLISIGSISIDLYFKGDSLTADQERFHLAVGGKYVVDQLYESVGGGGANVAIGGVKNGLQTAALGIIGNNPFKPMILNELKEGGVSSQLCQFQDDYLNLSSILLTKNGDRTIIHYEPTNEHIFSSLANFKSLLETRAVYLGNLADVSLAEREKILSFLKKNNISIFMNLGVKDCRRSIQDIEKLVKYADILILNAHELADMFKKDYRDLNFTLDIAANFNILSNKILVVTDGAKGSYAYANGKVYKQQATKISQIVDATGAGDAYTAAFIAAYL